MARQMPVEIKGTRQGLRILLEENLEFEELSRHLSDRLEGNESFLQGAQVSVEVGLRLFSAEEVKWLAWELEQNYGLRVLSFTRRGNSAPELNCYLAQPDPKKSLPDNGGGKEAKPAGADPGESLARAYRDTGDLQLPSLFVYRNLRSGQRVNYRGSVVVIGDVNPGAEIVAAGDIVVIGSLRGLAHAGAEGDSRAVVVALRLLPTQLRIAQFISRSPDEAPEPTAPLPEVAYLQDEQVVIDTYLAVGEKWRHLDDRK